MHKLAFGRYDYAACLTFAMYAACSIVIPMCLVALAADLSFPLDEGGMSKGGGLQLARSFAMIVTMLLCGFMAGMWGKRSTMGYSLLVMSAGIVTCAFAPVYGVVFVALLMAGLGEGIVEGLATPFVQDLHPDEPGRYLNLTHSFWSIGVVVLVLAAGALLQFGVSWRLIIGVVGVLTLIPALVFLYPDRSPTNPDLREGKSHWREVLSYTSGIMRRGRFWIYFVCMFFAGGAEFCLTFWCASFIQIAYGGSPWAAGLGTAIFSAGMVIGRIGSGLLVRQQHLQRLIIGMAAAGAGISMFLPYLQSLAALYPLLFLAGIACGPFWPSIQSHGDKRIPGDTTMMMILFSCAGVPGCGFFTWLMGFLGDAVGLRVSFLMIPACLVVVIILMGMEWRTEAREAAAAAEGRERDIEETAA